MPLAPRFALRAKIWGFGAMVSVKGGDKLGAALEQAGKPTEAIQHYQQALRINPDFTAARNALAQLQARQ